jgi:hypothetical protein
MYNLCESIAIKQFSQQRCIPDVASDYADAAVQQPLLTKGLEGRAVMRVEIVESQHNSIWLGS